METHTGLQKKTQSAGKILISNMRTTTWQNKPLPLHDIETKQLQSLGFNVIDLAAKGKKSYDTNVVHRHTFYELFFFLAGKGSHEIDFKKFTLEAGTLHFVAPGQIHKLSLNGVSGFVICFTEDFLILKPNENVGEVFPFFDSLQSPFFKLNKSQSAEIKLLVNAANHEFNQQPIQNADLLRHYLSIILIKLKIYHAGTLTANIKQQASKNQKVAAFKTLINKHYLNHLQVAEYARQLSLTPNHLNALCKQHEGRTAIELIHQRLTLEAKRLLYATDLSVKEIAFRLRYEDTGYFNRFFKSQLNLTPVQYRRSIVKNH